MKAWKKLLICGCSFLFTFFLNIAFDYGCGGEIDPYDYYTSFLHDNLQGQKEYGAFYLSWNEVFSHEEPESQDKINAQEWGAYLGIPLDTGLKKNTVFLNALSQRKQAKAYWTFALKAEPLANMNSSDQWDPKAYDTTKVFAAAAEALRLADKEDDEFCRLRYYYQSQRLYHYSKQYKAAADVYDKHIAGIDSKSHVKGWALACRAGEARWLGDTVKAAYLFSKVFAQYPERRVLAYKNYHYMNSVPVEPVLALAANNNERSQIYALEAFADPEFALPQLEHVYTLNPESVMVGVLLMREINKLEEAYLTPKLSRRTQGQAYLEYWDNTTDKKDEQKQLEQIKAVKAFSLKLAGQKKHQQPAIGYLAAAYLDWMTEKPAEGLKTLALADNEKLDKKLTDAVQLVRLLLQAQSISNLNKQTESKLLPLLSWLDKRVSVEAQETKGMDEYQRVTRFANSSRDFYNQVLAPAYLKQKDTVKAALCIFKSVGNSTKEINGVPFFWENYLRSAHVQQLLGIRLHKPTDPYLNLLSTNAQKLSLNNYYDLLGTAYLREHDYARAVAALKHIPPAIAAKWVSEEEGANPFIGQLRDYPKDFGKAKYTKLMFAQAMLDFQNKIKTNPATAADSYYRMGVGLYNASHYGNAYYLISYSWSSMDYGRPSRFYYDTDYIRTYTAERYFLAARKNSTSMELRAKATFMAAKCRQKLFVMPHEYVWAGYKDMGPEEKKYHNAIRNNPYFADLAGEYAKTSFYKSAVNECSYFRDFLRAKSVTNRPAGKK